MAKKIGKSHEFLVKVKVCMRSTYRDYIWAIQVEFNGIRGFEVQKRQRSHRNENLPRASTACGPQQGDGSGAGLGAWGEEARGGNSRAERQNTLHVSKKAIRNTEKMLINNLNKRPTAL